MVSADGSIYRESIAPKIQPLLGGHMPIDYERMKRVYPKQKAALTRAVKKGYPAVLETCKTAVREWDAIGA